MPEAGPQGRQGRDTGSFVTFAVGRWPVVVRMLVLLGAPPRQAEDVATTAVGTFLERCEHDDWLDLDVTLTAVVVDTWERDRTPWWRRPELRTDDELAGTGVPEVLGTLDVLTPTQRARVVAGVVAALTPEQLDEALGAAGPAPSGTWDDDVARLAPAIPVGEPRVAQARALLVERRRGGRRRVVAGVVAGLLVAVGLITVGVRAVDPQPVPDAAGGASTAASTPRPSSSPSRPAYSGPDLVPVAWYDGRLVHLPGRTVPVPRVVALVRVGDGVVATDDRGRVLHVGAGGAVETLGRTTPGARVVADPAALAAAWVDATSGAVVVRSVRGRATVLPTGPDGRPRVVALDDGTVFVDRAGGQPLTRAGDVVALQAPDGLLDVAGGTQARQRDPDLVQVSSGHQASGVPGRDGTLSDDGDYLVTRDLDASGDPLRSVVDLEPGTPLPLDLGARALVRDAAFGEGTVTFVVEDHNGIQYPPDRPRGRGFIPGFTLVVCDLASVSCQAGVEVFGTNARPLLAH